uniref:Uncharacterized protein n=1 Tax=Vibrio vulnificus TaxID=672 RepID=Q2V6R0_VIBVL|nr:hypothetical protein [Vibrio vulnificus]ABB90702.1 unknown [Vibrio vulnificus]
MFFRKGNQVETKPPVPESIKSEVRDLIQVHPRGDGRYLAFIGRHTFSQSSNLNFIIQDLWPEVVDEQQIDVIDQYIRRIIVGRLRKLGCAFNQKPKRNFALDW